MGLSWSCRSDDSVDLVLAETTGWLALRRRIESIPATLILLGINLVIAAIFGVLAAQSSPGGHGVGGPAGAPAGLGRREGRAGLHCSHSCRHTPVAEKEGLDAPRGHPIRAVIPENLAALWAGRSNEGRGFRPQLAKSDAKGIG
jgi:hypothetical protein